ncbi:MAG: NADH-quinone oxidoreductase subunit N [Candidatus Kariarchaeaceae archaeon]|jgi:NADH-quinone oxidoreductase subunit N
MSSAKEYCREAIKIELFSLAFLPVWILFLGIIVVLIVDLLQRENAQNALVAVTTLFLAAAAFTVTLARGEDGGDLFLFGDFFMIFALFGLLSSIIVVFSAWRDMSMELDLGVFFALLLLANIGGILLAISRNFIPLYVGYELVSIPTYAMVAFRKKNRNAAEAGMKIFLLGALSSAFIIYGIAMFYGATGSFYFGAASLAGSGTFQFLAVGLIAAGASFKIGLVPFHFWIPDVYSGAPLSVVNFLAASTKKMAFAFVFQLFFFAMPDYSDLWGPLFAILATASMILGNVAASVQNRVMRILAYSTIAQAGYIAIGLATFAAAADTAVQVTAMRGILFHISAHILMKGAAIMTVLLIVISFGNDHIDNFKGLYHKSPIVGGSMALALFSLMGIPPLAGFFGKYFLFLSAVQADMTWLAIVGVIGSAISIYYYGRILRIMADQPDDKTELTSHPGITVMLVILSLFTVILGLFGESIVTLAEGIIG